jgi:hypothetical protein
MGSLVNSTALTTTGILNGSPTSLAPSTRQMSPQLPHQALLQHTALSMAPTAVLTAPQQPMVPCTVPLAVTSYPHTSVPFAVEQQPLQQAAECTIFFAGLSPLATTEELLKVFAQFGRVMNINLYRHYRGCKTSKVCRAASRQTLQLILQHVSPLQHAPCSTHPLTVVRCQRSVDCLLVHSSNFTQAAHTTTLHAKVPIGSYLQLDVGLSAAAMPVA